MEQTVRKGNPLAELANAWKSGIGMGSEEYEDLVGRDDLGGPVVVTYKIDGELQGFEAGPGGASVSSREGRVRTGFPALDEMAKLAGKRTVRGVAELYMVDEEGRAVPYPLAMSALRVPKPGDEERMRLAVIDVLESDGKPMGGQYWQRWLLDNEIFGKGEKVHPVVAMQGDASTIEKMWEEGVAPHTYEGLVIYTNGVVKAKPLLSQDLAVIGVERSKKHPEVMGALLTAYMDPDENFRFAGKVGTGFTQEDRRGWMAYALENAVRDDGRVVWVRPDRVVEVVSEELNVRRAPAYNGSLKRVEDEVSAIGRKPRFGRIREDKEVSVEDLRLEQIPDWGRRASLSREAGYPKHPDTVIVPPNEWYPQGLNEAQIWSYYDSVKTKLVGQLSGSPVTVVTVTPKGPVVRRNDFKTGEPIRVDDEAAFDVLNNGRNVEFHRAMGKTTDVVWVDLDPKEEYPWPKIIDAAVVCRDSLMGYNGIENVRIAFSGGRGFHVRGFLKEPMDIDEARRMVIQRLESEAVPRIENSTTGRTDRPDSIRLDVSTLHSTGSLRVPWSLNAKTGLVAMDYEATGKGLAELEKSDFSIEKTQKYSYRNTDIPIGILIKAALDPEEAAAAVKKLTDVATAHGFRVYLVGGSVRDKLMGLQPKDLDVVVFHPEYGLRAPHMLSEALRKDVGAKGGELTNQGTVMTRVDGVPIDLAAPRSESYEADSRKPTVAAAGIKEDAMRRDFTVNALYEDLQSTSPDVRSRIVDPTGRGLADLDAKVLRSPNPKETFLEDPLRMLRAIRFHAKTGFELDPETADEMKKALPEFKKSLGTKKLSWERVQEEFQKALMTAAPGKAFRMMTEYGLTPEVIPEWRDMMGVLHDTPHHREPVDEHSFMVLDQIGELADSELALRLAALLHDIGKPATKGVGDQLGSFLGHEDVGAEMAEAILRRLRFPNDIVERVKFMVGRHMRPHGYKKEWTDKAVRRFVREMGGELENVLRLAEADARGRKTDYPVEQSLVPLQELRQRIEQVQTPGQEIAEMKPLLDGNEIMSMFPGRKPGKWIGDLHEHLIDLQLGNPSMTKEEAVEAAKAFVAGQEPGEGGGERTAALEGVRYDKPEELARAKAADLLDLPEGVEGTNCFNCKFLDRSSEGTVRPCKHPKVRLPVNARMCCAFWDNEGAGRDFPRPKQASLDRRAYVVHMPGHKNSKGEEAPWVIKKHETGEILSSHKSKEEAKRHLQQMHAHASAFSFDPNSTANEGRWRIRDPKDFDQETFRRWKTWAGVQAPEGVTFIVGDTKDGKAVQTIRFDKALWDEAKAGKFWESLKDKPGFKRTWEWPKRAALVVGTVGFCHERWRDTFYSGFPRDSFLHRYGSVFSGVEVPSTRHQLPTTRVLYRWASRVPLDFTFAPHAPASVVPSAVPAENRATMTRFLSRMSALGRHLGPVVITIPAWERYRPGDATAFLDSLPAHRYAFDIRRSWWFLSDEALTEIAKRGHAVVSCVGPAPDCSWFFVRTSAGGMKVLRDVLDGATVPGYAFVEDKSDDPSEAEWVKVLHDLGLLPYPHGVVPSRKMGPRDIRTDDGPGNAGENGPHLGPDSPPFEEPDPNQPQGEERSRHVKQRRILEPMDFADVAQDQDGLSDPDTSGYVDGDTRTV